MEYIKKNSTLFSILFSLFACFAMINLSTNQIENTKVLTNNIFIYFQLIAFYFLSKEGIKTLNKKYKLPLIFSIFLSLSIIIGNSLDIYLTTFKLKNIFNFIFLTPIIFLTSSLIFNNIKFLNNKLNSLKFSQKIEDLFFKTNKKSFLACFILIAIGHLPAFLAYFPGIFTYDVYYQASFFMIKDYPEINPLLHNLLIYLTLFINFATNSKTFGILCYTVFQSTIMFSIFAYAIQILSKYNINHYLKLFALLFFALHPINHIFSITATKDTLFSGIVLLFILQLIDLFQNRKTFTNDKKRIAFLILTIFLMFCLRHNGFVAYLIFLPTLLMTNKKYIKKSLIIFLTPIVLFSFYGLIKKTAGIKPAPIASSIGIPLQQMGRVRKFAKNLDIKDIETYKNLVSKEKELAYFPYNVDTIKIDSDLLHSNHIENALKKPLPYINLWLKWGIQHPKIYTDAFLLNNYTYWYPNMNFITISLHYFFYTQNRWDEIYGIGIEQKSFAPKIKKLYDEIFLNNKFEQYPIISNFFSISSILWLNILCFFILLYKKKYKLIMPLIFNFCLIFTILLGPISLLRYIYFNYLLLPLFLAFAFDDIKKNNVK
ncbi:MAG: hypothetical protein IJB79_06195 [Candidatus Gastranaerophilales bacterium]|nr:hypothetical protein [Candidatus Gastranaerophilales bacterium]